MQRILARVASERQFAELPFFRAMRAGAPYEQIAPVVPQLAFWVLTFHDALEIAEERMEDPALRALVAHHRREETGHDVWYLEDLRRLGVPLPDPVVLFSEAHAATRRAAYALVGEVLRSRDDHVRIALILMMEATGRVFFGASSAYRRWPVQELLFFSGHHLDVELDHQLFEARMLDRLRTIRLDDAVAEEALGAVDRGFAAFHALFAPLAPGR